MSEVLLECRNVHKEYTLGRKVVPVLKGVSLEVNQGESLAVMGASGSGKSTLLHVLGGLDRPDAGEVFFQDENVYGMSEAERARFRAKSVGFVFQAFHLLPELDVRENIGLPRMALSAGMRSRQGGTLQVDDLLKQIGLEDRRDHLSLELSGGEQQRVALARALVNEPDIVLADEPTGNLDSKTGDQILDLLFGLVGQSTRTLVMVTHNEAVAERCDRVLRLVDGVLG